MIRYLLIFYSIFISSLFNPGFSQSIDVDGAIVIGNDESVIPQNGTMRWNGKDFQGWNGMRWVSLTSHSNGIVYDIDGNSYRTVTIGDTEWMAENLRVTKFNDGSFLAAGTNAGGWQLVSAVSIAIWANVSYTATNKEIYGLLYNGFAIASEKNICPMGWHIPQVTDYDNLISELNSDVSKGGGFIKKRGNVEDGTGLWAKPNYNATDIAGFGGLPAGTISEAGASGGKTVIGYLWTNTNLACGSKVRDIKFLDKDLETFSTLPCYDLKRGASIRCIKSIGY